MEININGVIGDWPEDGNVVNGESMSDALAERTNDSEEIVVKINSPGGSVFEGFSMYNQLKAVPNPIRTEVNGMAASIASLIALAGDQVDMSEVSMMMIHRASTMAMGNQEELEKQAEILKSIDDTLINVYAQKTGISQKEIEEMISDETWMNSDEALEKGFVDNIINKIDAKMAALYKSKTNEKIMKLKDLFASFKNELSEEVVTEDVVTADEPTEEQAAAEESTEEPTGEPEAVEENYVTMEQFQKLLDRIEQMAESLDNSVEEQAEAAVAKIKTGLKRTNAAPTAANDSLTGDATKGWVDPHAKFRAIMKEVETETRLS